MVHSTRVHHVLCVPIVDSSYFSLSGLSLLFLFLSTSCCICFGYQLGILVKMEERPVTKQVYSLRIYSNLFPKKTIILRFCCRSGCASLIVAFSCYTHMWCQSFIVRRRVCVDGPSFPAARPPPLLSSQKMDVAAVVLLLRQLWCVAAGFCTFVPVLCVARSAHCSLYVVCSCYCADVVVAAGPAGSCVYMRKKPVTSSSPHTDTAVVNDRAQTRLGQEEGGKKLGQSSLLLSFFLPSHSGQNEAKLCLLHVSTVKSSHSHTADRELLYYQGAQKLSFLGHWRNSCKNWKQNPMFLKVK